MFNRIKQAWILSKKDPVALSQLEERMDEVPDASDSAVFLGEGTQEEWKEEEKAQKGFRGIFGL